MLPRQKPCLERKARGIGRERDEMVVFENHARLRLHFLTDHVAKNAALLFDEVAP